MQKHFTSFFEFLLLVALCLYSSALTSCDSFLTGVKVPEGYHAPCPDHAFGKTFFSIRPQDSNSALRLTKIISEDHRQTWGIDISCGLQRSFTRKENTLAKWFLFNGCTSVTVGIPSATKSFTVDGRQLGLETADGNPGFMGTLLLAPTLQNASFIANAWIDLSEHVCGLWLRTFFTVVQAKTALAMRTSCTADIAQSGNYPSGLYTGHTRLIEKSDLD
jgi:hypothetical protein